MLKCSNCGRQIPDGAKFCGHCGKTTNLVPNYLPEEPFVQYQVQPRDEQGQIVAAVDSNKTAKPNCDLSVAGFVLSVFSPYLCVIAFIVSALALGKKQVRRKLALAGLFISLIEILFVVAIYVVIFVLHVDVAQYIPFLRQQ